MTTCDCYPHEHFAIDITQFFDHVARMRCTWTVEITPSGIWAEVQVDGDIDGRLCLNESSALAFMNAAIRRIVKRKYPDVIAEDLPVIRELKDRPAGMRLIRTRK